MSEAATKTDEGDERVTVWLPKSEMEAFRDRHSQHGSITWFFREALKRYNELNTIDPDELIRTAVGEIKLI